MGRPVRRPACRTHRCPTSTRCRPLAAPWCAFRLPRIVLWATAADWCSPEMREMKPTPQKPTARCFSYLTPYSSSRSSAEHLLAPRQDLGPLLLHQGLRLTPVSNFQIPCHPLDRKS